MTETAQRELESLCERVGVEAPSNWCSFLEEVRRWGARTDLTAAKNDRELCEILFLDAAQLIRAGWRTGSLVDVGAGVGAPTLPLLGVDLAERGLLVEPRRKRVAFLRSAIGVLGLAGRATVHEGRIDPELPRLPHTPFDAALSRATFDPADWRRIGATLATEVWVFTAGAELPDDQDFEAVRSLRYEVPSSGAPRAIHVFRGA